MFKNPGLPICLTLSFIAISFLSSAQLPRKGVSDKGIMFIKLGKDTTVVQQFEMIGDSIKTIILRRPGGIQLYKGEGSLNADGTIRSMKSTIFRLGQNGVLQKFAENVLSTTADSTFIETNINDRRSRRAYEGKGFVANDMDYTTFLMFPYLGHFAPARMNDSVTGKHFVFGGFRVFSIRKTAARNVRVGSNIMGYLDLFLNADGSLNTINGIGSSLNFTSTVKKNLDMDSLVKAMISYQQQTGVMSPPTVRDTAKAIVGSTVVEIDYWRPSMRGRKIFGGVVPWNRFWRTGANNATQLRISQPIYFNDQLLDSGRYSIFTLPTETGWTLMVNRQATIWGTDYNSEYDILRLPMIVESIHDPVEQLSIQILPSGNSARIVIEWENTRASLGFKTINKN